MLCLVYNTTGEPLELVPSLLGLLLHLRGKAVILETLPGKVARSQRLVFPLPVSVVLRKHRRVRSRVAALTNEHLFLRDGHRCVYCGRHRREMGSRDRLTRDHLVPRSKGGRDEWLNVVTACSSCNHRKDNRMAEELGRTARIAPWAPTRSDLVIRRHRSLVSAVAWSVRPARRADPDRRLEMSQASRSAHRPRQGGFTMT